MLVRHASDDDIWHVCHNLRAEDAAEQFAPRFHDDPDELVRELVAARARAIAQIALCTDAGEAAIIVGAYLLTPTVAAFAMCSTAKLAELGRAGHRWGKQRFIPFYLAPNVARAECRLLADHSYARRWSAACGFVEEGICRKFGKHGEDFVHVAWINPERS